MGAPLAAIAYVWLAQAIAFLLMPWSTPLAVRVISIAFWAVAALIIFTVPNPLTALFLAAVALLVLAPLAPVKRAGFFLAVAPAVPIFIFAPLPFPGINYLTDITHYKLAALIVLAPVLLRSVARPSGVSITAIFLIIYILYTAIVMGAASSLTGGLRFLVDQILIIGVPYFAFHRIIRDQDDIVLLFQYFLVASLMLAVVAIVSLVVNSDMYASFSVFPSEFRGGRLRINTTIGTHALAFHLACALVILEFLKHRIRISRPHLMAIRLLLLAGMVSADSRGALLGLAAGASVYLLIMMKSAAARTLLLSAFLAAGGIGAWWLLQGDVSSYDDYGTFSYRQELLLTSVKYILSHPVFGDPNFVTSGAFGHLVQGQGIIDITNLYLQIGLAYGLLGLTLFSIVFVVPCVAGVLRLLRTERDGDAESESWRSALAATLSITVGWLFLIMTTSDVGITLHFGVVFAALSSALRAAQPSTVDTASSSALLARRPAAP